MNDEIRNHDDKTPEEIAEELNNVEVDELDDKGLEDASGGTLANEGLLDDNGNCNCAC
jgi:hypothetical protein